MDKKMSSTSTKKLKTLQGIFDPPKIVYRRDFVRENKLNLKPKNSPTPQNQESTPHHLARRGSNLNLGNNGLQSGSTASGQRPIPSTRISSGGDGNSIVNSVIGSFGGMSRGGPPRSVSLKNIKNAVIGNSQRCPSCSSRKLSADDSCDKQSQTEDILDEEFLYHALKKCVGDGDKISQDNMRQENTLSDGHHEKNLASYDSGDNNHDNVSRHSYSHYTQQDAPYDHFQKHDTNYLDDNRSVMSNSHLPAAQAADAHSVYSQKSHKSTNSLSAQNAQIFEKHNMHVDRESAGNNIAGTFDRLSLKPSGIFNSNDMPVQDQASVTQLYKRPSATAQFDQMSVNSHGSHRMSPHSDQMSVHSRTSVHSKAGSHKLGSRENLTLPPYLEREKREKQVEQLREMSRDPKCPIGFMPLNEEERIQELKEAEKQFNLLVSELNHLPMTSETLRARRRKQEIEKQLNTVENKIRLYSKANVYVPQDHDEHQDEKQQL